MGKAKAKAAPKKKAAPPLRLEYRKPSELAANPANWRRHPEAQLAALADVIADVGWAGVLLYNERTKRLIDGHARKEIAEESDEPVPVVIGNWSEAQERTILATLDPLAAMAEADSAALESLLEGVSSASAAVNAMLDELRATATVANVQAGGGGDDFDATPEEKGPTRTKPGELWVIGGKHRLFVGDCTVPENVARLMGGGSVDSVVTDPPYGVAFDTDYTRFSNNGARLGGKTYQPIAGDEKPFDPTPLLGYKHVALWGANCYSDSLPIGTWLVWDKRFANGKALLSDAEVAWVKGGHGVYIHAETTQGFLRAEPAEHPTQKPLSVMQWAIEKSKAGPTVYDPFLGSGTTLVAAHRLGRVCYGCELEPRYADVILKRAEAEGLECVRSE